MQIKNCEKCGKMFQWVAGDVICENCKKAAEEAFQNVKKYLEEHPSATMNELSKECDVKLTKIQQWVREERLVFAKGSPVELTCENCGEPISTGRYCNKCKAQLASGLGNLIQKPGAPAPERKRINTGHAAMQFLKK
ncbi:MAG: flagellar protein [Lachnospiraceae bacterium]|nr:flagellar protein [Lachnospiraceae bacterium]